MLGDPDAWAIAEMKKSTNDKKIISNTGNNQRKEAILTLNKFDSLQHETAEVKKQVTQTPPRYHNNINLLKRQKSSTKN